MKNSFSVRDMIYIALMAVVLALCSWISVPSVVPFTMQTFAVFCALLLLGGRRGFFAVLLYILLAAVGLPVLSGFRGGIGALLGPTGGYAGYTVLSKLVLSAAMLFGRLEIYPLILTFTPLTWKK